MRRDATHASRRDATRRDATRRATRFDDEENAVESRSIVYVVVISGGCLEDLIARNTALPSATRRRPTTARRPACGDHDRDDNKKAEYRARALSTQLMRAMLKKQRLAATLGAIRARRAAAAADGGDGGGGVGVLLAPRAQRALDAIAPQPHYERAAVEAGGEARALRAEHDARRAEAKAASKKAGAKKKGMLAKLLRSKKGATKKECEKAGKSDAELAAQLAELDARSAEQVRRNDGVFFTSPTVPRSTRPQSVTSVNNIAAVQVAEVDASTAAAIARNEVDAEVAHAQAAADLAAATAGKTAAAAATAAEQAAAAAAERAKLPQSAARLAAAAKPNSPAALRSLVAENRTLKKKVGELERARTPWKHPSLPADAPAAEAPPPLLATSASAPGALLPLCPASDDREDDNALPAVSPSAV